MERAVGPIIAIALIIAIGAGVYAFSLHGQLSLAQAAQAAAEQKATQATQQNQATLAKMSQNGSALSGCQTQLQEATTRAAAAEQAVQDAQTAQSKSGGGKKR